MWNKDRHVEALVFLAILALWVSVSVTVTVTGASFLVVNHFIGVYR